MISETFCILPWIHVSVGIVGNHRLCCYQSQDKKDADSGDLKIKGNLKIDKIPLEDIWNSEMYREVRKRMISGEPIGVCSKCYREERSGVTSYRNLANRQFSSNIPEINSDGMCSLDSIRYLDIKFGNKCNLKCRMCYAPVSSSLIAEEKRYGVHGIENIEDVDNLTWCYEDMFWSNLQKIIKNCSLIHIAGGEPLLEVEQQTKFLKMCIDEGVAENINLEYNTNLTMDLRPFEKYWRSFSSVLIKASIDGFGKVNEYIRYPSKWETISKNFNVAYDLSQKENPSFMFSVTSTVAAYNIFDLIDLLEYLKQFKMFPGLNILNSPLHYNLKVLPNDKKERAASILKEWYSNNIEWLNEADLPVTHSRIEQVIEYMFQDDWSHLFPTFLKHMHKLDKIRSQKMEDYIPELRR